MIAPTSNGSTVSRAVFWLLTVVVNLLITGAIAWLTMAHADVLDVQTKTSLLAARLVIIESAMPNLDKRLSRIEDKLDSLNERLGKSVIR